MNRPISELTHPCFMVYSAAAAAADFKRDQNVVAHYWFVVGGKIKETRMGKIERRVCVIVKN